MVFARGFSVRMMKTLIGIVAVSFLLFGLTACETTSPKGMHVHPKVGLNTLTKLFEQKVTDDDLVGSSHRAADSLIKKAGARLDTQRSIAAASFVNIDNLEESSSFGRTVSRQLATRPGRHSFP